MAITTTEGNPDDWTQCRARVKFLIDECLSPELVLLAHERGHGESTHVIWLGLRSRKDWAIVRRAVDDGYVLVTNNTTDFAALLSHEHVHAGLVCVGLMSLDVQRRAEIDCRPGGSRSGFDGRVG